MLPALLRYGQLGCAALLVGVPALFALRAFRRSNHWALAARELELSALGPLCDDVSQGALLPLVALRGTLRGIPEGLRVTEARLAEHPLRVVCGGVEVPLRGVVVLRRGSREDWATGHPVHTLAAGETVRVRGRLLREVDAAAHTATAYRATGERFVLLPLEGEKAMGLVCERAVVATPGAALMRALVAALIAGLSALAIVSVLGFFLANERVSEANKCSLSSRDPQVLAAATLAREAALRALVRRQASASCADEGAEARVQSLEALRGRGCELDALLRNEVPFGDPSRAARYLESCAQGALRAAPYWYRAGELTRASQGLSLAGDGGEAQFVGPGAIELHLSAGDTAAADRALAAYVARLEREADRARAADPGHAERLEQSLTQLRNVGWFLRGRGRTLPARELFEGELRTRVDALERLADESRELDRVVLSALRFDDPIVAAWELFARPSRIELLGVAQLELAAHARLAARADLDVDWRSLRVRLALRAAMLASAAGAGDLAQTRVRDVFDDLRVLASEERSASAPLDDRSRPVAQGASSLAHRWAEAQLVAAVVSLRDARLPPRVPVPEGLAFAFDAGDRTAMNAVAQLQSDGNVLRFSQALRRASPRLAYEEHGDSTRMTPLDTLLLRARFADEPDRVALRLREEAIFDVDRGAWRLSPANPLLVRRALRDLYDLPPGRALASPFVVAHRLVEAALLARLVDPEGSETPARAASAQRFVGSFSREHAVALAALRGATLRW